MISAKVCGIVTDRDLVVKAIASGSDPSKTSIGSVCTKDVTVLKPTQTTDDSVKIMREKAIRRLPVVASYVPTVAAGSIATVFGSNLSIGTASSAAANPLPFTLASSSFQTGAAELPPIPRPSPCNKGAKRGKLRVGRGIAFASDC